MDRQDSLKYLSRDRSDMMSRTVDRRMKRLRSSGQIPDKTNGNLRSSQKKGKGIEIEEWWRWVSPWHRTPSNTEHRCYLSQKECILDETMLTAAGVRIMVIVKERRDTAVRNTERNGLMWGERDILGIEIPSTDARETLDWVAWIASVVSVDLTN